MKIDFAGSVEASIGEGLAPSCTLLIHLQSISTATERCNKLTDRTSFSPDLILRTIPDKPCSGPSSIRTTCPTSKYGQGIVGRPLLPTRWIAAISCSSTGMGVLPTPTIGITPAATKIDSRLSALVRQHKSPVT